MRITHVPHLRDARTAHVPQSRDALTRAKDDNPTTLLTRFAEELRRAPEAGGGAEMFDFECLILNYLKLVGRFNRLTVTVSPTSDQE